MSFIYNHIKINEEKLKVGVYCPAFNCDPLYIEYNRKVFNYFGINVNYVTSGSRHGEILNTLSREENVDYLCFVDVDAIPLSPNVLETLIGRIYNKNAIIGIEQNSNRLPFINNTENTPQDDPCYAGPAFFVISKKTYTLLGEPSYLETYRSDCGEELSYASRDKGVEVKYLAFSKCVKPIWPLKKDIKFGIGSTYENLVYHNFQSRESTSLDMFIGKCKEVLN